ncbi:hypothetical protein [Demequina phytophila]|uniref:hypothetical protein n=1 Tax=Demequina phytophila TaxID=1638981 RepID=UPI0007808C90|nr:hypothetical protein [Demequina phytophila]
MSIQITADLGPTLVEEGTVARRQELEQIAEAVRQQAPGTAAALVDWSGTEISRLRAWAVARSILVERVSAADREAFRLVA